MMGDMDLQALFLMTLTKTTERLRPSEKEFEIT
jgi:hypothetical protein